MKDFVAALSAICLFGIPAAPLAAQTTAYRVLVEGKDSGHLVVKTDASRISVDFDYKQNGRGPTFAEEITVDERGYPVAWTIRGTTTFGRPVDEYFRVENGVASWRDTTGSAEASVDGEHRMYVSQAGSFYSLALLARALLESPDRRLEVYPAGEATIVPRDTLAFDGPDGEIEATTYEIYGLAMNPLSVMLDQEGRFFAVASPSFATIRAGYEGADEALRDHAARLSTERFVDIQKNTAHRYEGPVRIRNVRVFDPVRLEVSEPKDVVIYGERVASIQAARSPTTDDETAIDGGGGTLVPGLYEMHGHLDQEQALLNLVAGITSVRDMGNENDVLDSLIERIEDGVIAGPRVTRSCFIEGQSEYSAATGLTVATVEEALDAVRWCGARDFQQVKLYNSMRPEWAAALTQEAHRLGMRVAGHVPAFSTADAMIDAGFDEITHVNQLMLGWVLNEGEDTRTLFRFTAMRRFPSLDLEGRAVQSTFRRMLERGIVHDPTIAIHEQGLTGVNGEASPAVAAIIDHLPTNVQRSARTEMLGTETPREREEYVAAFEVVLATLRRLHEAGVLLVPGTDMGGSFAYHRELELFERIGLSPAEVLRRATLDMATYLGQSESLGSIEKGKYADFFLVSGDPTKDLSQIRKISMVVANGVVYFPSEIYPWFGVRPFGEAPVVTSAAAPER